MATKSTASKASAPHKRTSRKQAEPTQKIEVPLKNVLVALLKSYGIKEGFWVLEAQTGTGQIGATKSDGADVYPATLVVLEGVALVRVSADDKILASENTIDASEL